ncbi:DhaKLM operon coactivator DhaQ [Vagococcus salmoninarum]|uniref:DhaKLM operon coactivator DhaQ n=1 Tax=Vagococcus salmoninarum TaxID=2739 RepID=A0A429ZVQ4_9ENTE|nr:DhaKLM operon coactivator DhaQ [Vagococcus salmoninarum]RST97716.1 DhaKLM operon coactivator DhaQ [Vagococcus salmoninarum]
MKKIINRSTDVVTQLLNGINFAYADILERVPKTGIILSKVQPQAVAVISGGGTGHEPAHSGYVGENMLAASINGPIFIPPTVAEIVQTIQLVDKGQGVLLIVKNFEADVTNFLAAEKLAQGAGHQVAHIIVNDDCSIDKETFKKRRRGVAGTVFVHKILSGAAAAGQTLKELTLLGEQVVMSLNTLGLAVAPGTLPGESAPQFQLGESEISFGIGIHGEAGYREEPISHSEKLANELINKLKSQYQLKQGSQLALLINGLGGTTALELMIFANDVRRLLELDGIDVQFKKVGNFMTSLNMAGVSLTFLEIKDPQWLTYLQLPVSAYGW